MDLRAILEYLHTSSDVNVQVKLFATLSAYLISNGPDIDGIIMHTSLYDKICGVLSNCPPTKATVMFNFVSALLSSIDESCKNKRVNLATYAKNMLRSSGCLSLMCELFTSCMMHQDVWRSLCRCIAETCRGMEANQSYCTHLVPMSVQKCSQGNIDVFQVLQSLLMSHTRNIQLFIDCKGISIFRRELLQHAACLHLLSTLVQSSPPAAALINDTDVRRHLTDFLRLYGPNSQLGQWATIIMYYTTGPEGIYEPLAFDNQARADGKKIAENKPIISTNNEAIAEITDLQCTTDTTRFIQNIMKEIIQCGSPNDFKYMQQHLTMPLTKQVNRQFVGNTQPYVRNQLRKTNMLLTKQNISRKYSFAQRERDVASQTERIQNDQANDLTFSFLQKLHDKCGSITKHPTRDDVSKSGHRIVNDLTTTKMSYFPFLEENTRHGDSSGLSEFRPIFASTPKKNTNEYNRIYTRNFHNSLQTISNLNSQHSVNQSTKGIRKKRPAAKAPTRLEHSTIDKDAKHRSISGWFFEAINESCTTLVKTVKNIFRPKLSLAQNKAKLSNNKTKDGSFCSYSFTKYMRKRDAILTNGCSRKSFVDFSMEISNTCNTCDDTIALQNKLANDEYLKQIVRKLKLGINLYGCDFKRIAKQLWPQQTYMTPVVLYNLYRKLILK